MSENICCATARDLMDARQPSGDEQRLLNDHLSLCAECCAEAKVEEQVRQTICECCDPALPSNFEAALMTRLQVAPVERPDLLAHWGWVPGVLGLAAVMAPFLGKIWRAVESSAGNGLARLPAYGTAAEVVTRALWRSLDLHTNPMLLVNITLATLALLGGAAAVRSVMKE
jgi:hypothetical protein